jgi:hypothetical protein
MRLEELDSSAADARRRRRLNLGATLAEGKKGNIRKDHQPKAAKEEERIFARPIGR